MPCTILIVEDEMLLVLDLEDVLFEAGYSVIGSAVDMHQAIAFAERHGRLIDAAIMDVNLARGTNGVQTAGRLWKHSTLQDIEGLVSRAFIAEAFVVTLVRNPWDRVVSYYHWLRGQAFDHPAVGLAKALEFSAFLNHPQTRASLKATPYGSYVQGPEGGERCDRFIRLEAFEADAAPLWAHLGFRLALPHFNASARGEAYQEYYSAADSALVEELCGEDIARFGYRFS